MTWIVYALGAIGALVVLGLAGIGLTLLALSAAHAGWGAVADYSGARNDSERGL